MTNVSRSLAICSVNGAEMINPETKEVLTLEFVACKALVTASEQDAREPLNKTMARWELCKKLSRTTEDSVTLTAEEIILLKERLNASYSPLIVGQIVDHIERK